jgi:phosphate transport system substrate-binding protein
MQRLLCTLLIVVLCLLGTVMTAWSVELKIGAGAAPTENILKPIKEPFEKATGLKLAIIASGPKIGLQELQKGTLDAAAAGLSFNDWLAMMKVEGSAVVEPAAMQSFTIGKDRIVVITHKDNPVKRLSKEELQGIFTGATANWKELGGNDLPIMIVWGKLIQGTNSMFVSKMLDGKPQAKEVLEATTAEDVRQNVAANEAAVGIGPLAILDGSVNSPETPELAREITLVTKGKPSDNMQRLLDFIRGEGQKYIKQ